MSAREPGVIHQAVVFFAAGNVAKEMLQVEFEAVLDQVVGLPEFAGQEICACFLRINQRLQIVGAVFFLVDFDARGYVNRSWNVPLQHLLDNAGRGQDLGGGRIRLACRSQCSVPWHSRQLWDPVLEGDNNSLLQMAQAVRRNRLGLAGEVPDITDEVAQPPLLDVLIETEPTTAEIPGHAQTIARERLVVQRLNQRLQNELRGKMAAFKEEQQLQVAALKSAQQQQLDQLHQHYHMQLNQLKEAGDAARQLFLEEQQRARKLKATLAEQADEFQRAREQLQQEVTEQREVAQVNGLDQLQQQFAVELKARVEQAGAELKEMLDMREVELFYREEQLGTLREEIARLRTERERLISQGGDRLLQHLVDHGVAFVAYQPGVDAMTIPAADIPRYLDSPVNYVAEKCMVTPQQYQQWLSHHELPVCTALEPGGALCGALLEKTERPNQFLPGSSDRCTRHCASGQAPRAPRQAGSS